ncbi:MULTISPECIES: uroporphyrinogen-III synthase [unclassified Psychrobacter]|uniref:uroporphyrinogen-III synthase n=1 Tax=unclassified Psychrobacter TaxID=196806 RepID=UPI0025B53818|nr:MULTISPECIES: uroporphyrinogen-III synthase [unclassified Psychrobacter]MDN3452536.1 uroporphyrinogen-III synthase [Psychrobacter sp. APC 3350]MDN3501679.1 uroporphyrinogen-III synthase [Psychrobacter sp. 5A.1]
MTKLTPSVFCHGTPMSSTSIHATPVPIHKNHASEGSKVMPKIVINTRPIERAAPLTQHLKAAGLSVVEIPMLTLQPRPTTDHDIVLMRQWLAGEYNALVIVSPTAAAAGLAVWQRLEHENQVRDDENDQVDAPLKPPSHIIAVGEATAAVLNNTFAHELEHQVRQPEIANNEGMLAMPDIKKLQAGDKLLIWRGLGGRRLLVDTLQARGVHSDSIAWYERTMPIDAVAQYQQWRHTFLTHDVSSEIAPSKPPKPVVVISSAAAFEHWSSIVEDGQPKPLEKKQGTHTMLDTEQTLPLTLTDFSYVVLGERLANMVAEQQLNHWRVEDLAPETILSAISTNA